MLHFQRKRVPTRDTNLGPPNNRRWRFRPASGALVLTLLVGNAVPSVAATDASSVAPRNGGTSVLFDSSTIQSPDGELVFNEIDFSGCTVEGRDGTTYHDLACVDGVSERKTRGLLGAIVGAIGGFIIGGPIGAIGGAIAGLVSDDCKLFGKGCPPSYNHPPTVSNPTYTPSPMDENIFPEPINVKLSWEGNDPENEPIIYSVFFGTDRLGHCENISASSCIIPESYPLEFGKSYFWIVEATDSYGNVQKGEPWSFSIRGNFEPTLKNLSPDNEKEFEKVENITLKWEGNDQEGDDIEYSVFLGTELLTHCKNISAQTCTIPEGKLEWGKSYFWVVEATDTHGNTQKGEPWGFSIRDNHKPTVNNDLPIGGNTFSEPTDVTLEWEGSDIDGDDITYSVFFGTELFAPCENTTANTCIIPKDQFDFGKSYFWQVEAKDEYGNIQKGVPWGFSIGSNHEPKLEILSPPDKEEFQEIGDVTLEWEGTDQEDEDITYSVFFGGVPISCGASETSCIIPKGELNFGTSYLWWVKATDSYGNITRKSSSFSVRGNSPPHRAENPTPADNDMGIDYTSNVELGWDGNGDPDGDDVTYDVYVSDVKSKLISLNTDDLICQDVSNTLSCMPENNGFDDIEGSNSYFWRVVANDEHSSSTKGFFWQFDTKLLPEAAAASFKVNFSKGVVNESVVPEEKINFTVKFTDTSSGEITSWLWDFGVPKEGETGNQTSDEQNPAFTYEESGTYLIKLTVKDAFDNESFTEMNITVEDLESVPLMVLPGVDTMKLDWSMESINTYIPDPVNTVFQFLRTESVEGQNDDWQMIEEVNYMDSSISANKYFDEDDAEGIPEMVKEHKYCYYFKVLNRKGSDDNLLTQSEEVCNIIGAVQIFINDVPSAAPGQNVYIPVKISNAKGLKIAGGNLRLTFDTTVFDVGEDPTGDLETELSAALNDYKYGIYEKNLSEVNDEGRIVDFVIENTKPQNVGELPDAIANGGSEFFMITGKVRNDVAKGTRTQFFWEPDGSSMGSSGFEDIMLSFGDASFRVKSGRRLRDSKLQPTVDGYFTVDTKGRLGDPNMNGSVTTVDGMLALAHITDKNAYSFSDKQIAAADVNGNGKIDANDAARIFYYSHHGEWLSSNDSQSAQDDSPMSIELGNMSGESGTETETTLNVTNLSDFTGGEFILSYNPDVVAGISNVEQTTFTNDFTVFFHDNGEGKVRIAMANREPINGSGELATIKLRLKAKTTLRRGTRDGTTVGKRNASLVLTQTQFFDPIGRDFVNSLQRTVERKNAEVVRTDVVEVGDDTSTGGNSTPNGGSTGSKLPKVSGQILDKDGDPIVGVTLQIADKTTVTDNTGYWAVIDLTEGEYSVNATKEGYTFPEKTCVVADNENCHLDFSIVNTGIDTGNEPVDSKYAAYGIVIDENDNPVVNATIQVGDKTTATGETGYWKIADLDKGEYTVTAVKEGYTFVPQTFVIEDDDVIIQPISVDSKNDVAELISANGYILDDDNKPVAGVTVQMGDKTVVTDDDGYWRIDGLTNGIHKVTASKEGYWFAPKKLAVIDADVVIEMGNNGPYRAGGVITDESGIPIAGVEVKIGDEKAVTGNVGYWEINGLREGDDYVATASKEGYIFAPTNFVLGDNNQNFEQEISIKPISEIKVNIVANSRTVQQDDNITYTITVTNGGTETATGIVLTDELPEGTSFVSIGVLDGGECDVDTVTCILPDLTTGNFARVELVVNNTQTNRLLNTATITSNEYPTDVDKERTRVIPHLSVSIDDTPDPIAMSPAGVERTLHYTLTAELSPNAPSAATGIELVTRSPSGVELQSINSDYGMCDSSNFPTLICSLTDLSVDNPDDISQVTVNVAVSLKDAGLLVLTSEAKISANEYSVHIDRERTQVFVPPDYTVEMAVVIDVTGSMQQEINGVKKSMRKFIDELDQSAFPSSALVTFRDDVTVKAVTSDSAVLTNAINGIKVSGGGTCPEASVEALNKAVDHVEDGGTILFVTDASPYDDADVDALLERFRAKSIKLNAIITGDCTNRDSWNELPSSE